MKPLRIGLFGGTFDPPHNAHVALAQAALAQLALDALHVLPTGEAWHKARTPSAAADRVAMAALAFGGLPGVVVDEQETLRHGPSYTVDTLHALQARYPGAQFFLVIGADQASDFMRWHRAPEILSIATICVAQRIMDTPAPGDFASKWGAKGETFAHILHLQMPAMQVSATDIRQRVARQQGIAHLVPGPVARYIEQHQFYQTTPPPALDDH